MSAGGRNAGLDLLKGGTTLLVVLHHTAITYGGSGGWFYRELPAGGSPSSLLLTFFCALNQAWFMGLFFLLAGYFTLPALRAKGAWGFLRDRLVRLGLPLLAFGLVIGPATVALAQTARGQPFADTLVRLWQRGAFEPGPLWFAWALLLFSLAAAAWQALRPVAGAAGDPWPSDRCLLVAALATGAAAFALRLAWPVGVNVWALQLGYFASYVVLFAFGMRAAASGWLERVPEPSVRRWWRAARLVLPVLPVLALLAPAMPLLQGRAEGGVSVPAVVYALWEPFIAWGAIGLLLWRSQPPLPPRPWQQRLARRAFAIFVIHPPVVVALSLAWRDVGAPALVKFALTGALACVLCHLLAGALLRLPGLRRVL